MLIKILDEKNLEKYWMAILEVDQSQMGHFEKWNKLNYFQKLPLKFNISQLAIKKNEVLGFIIASRKGECAHIHRLAVRADHLKKGIGSELIAGVEEKSRFFGLHALSVETLKGNLEKFYIKNNFKKISEKEKKLYSLAKDKNIRNKFLEQSVVFIKKI